MNDGLLVLGLFTSEGQTNLGSSADWADRDALSEKALEVTYRVPGMPLDTTPRIVEDNTGEPDWLPEDDDGELGLGWTTLAIVVFAILLVTAGAYFSSL
jgi:hypothetical protein